MSHNLQRILIVMILLLIVISPVAGQGDEENEDPQPFTFTTPGDGDTVVVFPGGDGNGDLSDKLDLFIQGTLALLAAMIVLAGMLGYNTVRMIRPVLNAFQILVELTPGKDDDEALHDFASRAGYVATMTDSGSIIWTPKEQPILSQASPADWTPENAIEYLQARNFRVMIKDDPANWQSEPDREDRNWQGQSGPFSPASESMQTPPASYLDDDPDDFLPETPVG